MTGPFLLQHLHAFGAALAGGTASFMLAGFAANREAARRQRRSDPVMEAFQSRPYGLGIFDANERLIVHNERFTDYLALDTRDVLAGTSARTVLRLGQREPTSDPAMRSDTPLRDLIARGERGLAFPGRDGSSLLAVCEVLATGCLLLSIIDRTATLRTQAELEDAQLSTRSAQLQAERAAGDAEAAHARLRDAFEALPEALVLFDKEDRCVLWNQRYAELYGSTDRSIMPGVRFEDLLRAGLARGDYPDAVGQEDAWLQRRLERHSRPWNSHEQLTSAGRWDRVEERRTADGGSIGVRIDITDLKQQNASFELLFDRNPIAMWVHDQESMRICAVNDAALAYFGYGRPDFLQRTVTEIIPDWTTPPGTALPGAPVPNAQGRATHHLGADGRPMESALYGQALPYQGRPMALMAAADMSERKRAEARMAFLAHHDPLTELPNRAMFATTLEDALQDAQRHGRRFAVLCLDLDQFKDANDVFGHGVGDVLLQAMAQRLRDGAGDCCLARVGGDEFNVIAKDADLAAAEALGQRLLATVAEPFEIQGHNLRIGLSIGLVVYPEGGNDAATLLANADAALYRAKAAGRLAVRSFDPEMDRDQRNLQALQHDLRFALVRHELHLNYQPQVLGDGTIFGFEALLRWRHPQRGTVPPDVFITLAERNGMIGEIGAWVLAEACHEAATWAVPLQVAVNLSPVQFRDRSLAVAVAAILEKSGLPPHRLELEVTESILIKDRDRALTILQEFKELGVKIAMDDFGTGYSSLSSLKAFPFDKMKIDRSFVAEIGTGEQSAEVLRAIIAVATAFHIGVIAEGVETEEQRAFLAREGCQEMQGYLFGRPAAVETFAGLTQRCPVRDTARPLVRSAAA